MVYRYHGRVTLSQKIKPVQICNIKLMVLELVSPHLQDNETNGSPVRVFLQSEYPSKWI